MARKAKTSEAVDEGKKTEAAPVTQDETLAPNVRAAYAVAKFLAAVK